MLRKLVVGCAAIQMLAVTSLAAAPADFGTADEAKAMLEKAVVAVKEDKAKALDMFNKGEGGFKDKDLYVWCANVSDGTRQKVLDAAARLDYRPTARDSARLTLTRNDSRLTPQGNISAINIVNVGYKHNFSAALSAVAMVSDLFNGQKTRRVVSTPGLTQVYERITNGRVVFLGLNYAFGVEDKESSPQFDYDS